MSNIFNTPDTTASYAAADVQNNKVMAVLSYIGILVLIPILAAKESPFARFHANQGLILFLCEIIFAVANMILSAIFAFLGPLVLLWTLVAALVNIAFLVLLILGIVNAAQGMAKELPLIGKFRILKYGPFPPGTFSARSPLCSARGNFLSFPPCANPALVLLLCQTIYRDAE